MGNNLGPSTPSPASTSTSSNSDPHNSHTSSDFIFEPYEMAPKRVQVARADARRPAPKGYDSNVYNTLTSPENASVVRSVAVFGVAIAFFSSSWSEFLLPPFVKGHIHSEICEGRRANDY